MTMYIVGVQMAEKRLVTHAKSRHRYTGSRSDGLLERVKCAKQLCKTNMSVYPRSRKHATGIRCELV